MENGQNQPLCSSTLDIPPIFPSLICPIQPPSISPIMPLQLAPLGLILAGNSRFIIRTLTNTSGGSCVDNMKSNHDFCQSSKVDLGRLRSCYDEMVKLPGLNVESFESVKLVEEYRRYWRPEKVRVLLLAESHVFTSDADRNLKLVPISNLPNSYYPDQYAKFVYCLAYGEKSLLAGGDLPTYDGTPQFWKLLFSCVNNIETNASFRPVQRAVNDIQRISNKVKLLTSLQNNGIWLVDASIMALYRKGGIKPPRDIIKKAIQISWRYYIQEVVQQANPERVIVIGQGVANELRQPLKGLSIDPFVIAQPNAHLKTEQHLANFRKCYSL
jgi:hypothetical protein